MSKTLRRHAPGNAHHAQNRARGPSRPLARRSRHLNFCQMLNVSNTLLDLKGFGEQLTHPQTTGREAPRETPTVAGRVPEQQGLPEPAWPCHRPPLPANQGCGCASYGNPVSLDLAGACGLSSVTLGPTRRDVCRPRGEGLGSLTAHAEHHAD